MRHRSYKNSHIQGSLRPAIAAALAFLSRPKADDVVIDPMCGAGTILIERALMGRYKNLIAGDIEESALDATKSNFGAQHRPREFRQWDARKLPLPNESVDKIITNPPWGRQMGTPEYLQSLYAGFVSEADRVLKAGGMMVVLTSETSLLKAILAKYHRFQLAEQIRNVHVLGWPTEIFVIVKKATA
jgi:tRNA G10  N-methylase Trm11